MKSLVSVIITTYKGKENICKAVDSVLNQTYSSVEVIVVDDNGLETEAQIQTVEALKEYIDTRKITYVPHEKNRNGSVARNTGVSHSNGTYICFLDDDDCFMSQKVELQVKKFKSLPDEYGMLYCSFRVVEKNNFQKDVIASKEGNIALDVLLGRMRIASSLLMIKREAYLKLNGFDDTFNRHQDWEFIVRFCEFYKVSYIEDICIIKYMLNRNVPKTGELTEKYRLYYLEKMQPIINKYDEATRKQIYSKFYREIAKTYFLCGQYGEYWSYVVKSKSVVKCSVSCIKEKIKPHIKKIVAKFRKKL